MHWDFLQIGLVEVQLMQEGKGIFPTKHIFTSIDLNYFQAMRSDWAVSHWLFGGLVALAGGEGDTPGDMFPR